MNQPASRSSVLRASAPLSSTARSPADSIAAATAESPCNIAIVASRWHQEIVSRGTTAIHAALDREPLPPRVDLYEVPGAYEIPLHVRRLCQSGRYDAVIACGFVVNGGIYRHEFVAAAVIDALMRVQLDTDVPVFSAVLTPRDFHETEAHESFFRDYLVLKGQEVARACVETLAGLATLPVHRC